MKRRTVIPTEEYIPKRNEANKSPIGPEYTPTTEMPPSKETRVSSSAIESDLSSP